MCRNAHQSGGRPTARKRGRWTNRVLQAPRIGSENTVCESGATDVGPARASFAARTGLDATSSQSRAGERGTHEACAGRTLRPLRTAHTVLRGILEEASEA